MLIIKTGKIVDGIFERSLNGEEPFTKVMCAFDSEKFCGEGCAAFGITNPVTNPEMVGSKFLTCSRFAIQQWVMARLEGTGAVVKMDSEGPKLSENEDAK